MTLCRPIRHGCAAALLVLMFAGCSDDDAPVPPVAPAPDGIVSVQPSDRATGVLSNAPIWVEFREALDPATVTTANVRLKADTRRIPITVAYEGAARRIHVTPGETLDLRRTYTVEVTDGVRTPAGAALTGGYFWQFTTISVRAPDSPSPMDGALDESPFVLLRWKGLTESSVGAVEYELRVGTDSSSVTDTTIAPLAVLREGRFLSRSRWRQDSANWWSVRARNTDTGEALQSLAWRFECMPVVAPADTIDVPMVDFAYFNVSLNRTTCGPDSVASGNLLTGYCRWAFAAPDSTRRLAAAMIDLTPWPRYQSQTSPGSSVWAATDDWPHCTAGFPGPPFVDEVSGRLADGQVLRPDRHRFQSDALTAHAEAMVRFGGYYGYVMRSSVRMSYYPPVSYPPSVLAQLRIVVYRASALRPAAPVVRATRRAPSSAPGGTGWSRPRAAPSPAARGGRPTPPTS